MWRAARVVWVVGCIVASGVGPGLASGCAYRWAGSADATPLGRVAVRMPENLSGEPGLERLVAEALRRAVLRRAGAELVEETATADWVVGGRVLPLRVAPASLSPVVLTLEYEVTLSLDLRARRGDGREVVGDARALRETERFLSSADVEAQRKNRDEALRRVCRLLATRFLDGLDEDAASAGSGEDGA